MKAYLGMFDYQHRNPPAPFNPDFKPYASKALSIAVSQLEEEGFYEKYPTRQERIDTGLIAQRYQQICEEFEQGKRSL